MDTINWKSILFLFKSNLSIFLLILVFFLLFYFLLLKKKNKNLCNDLQISEDKVKILRKEIEIYELFNLGNNDLDLFQEVKDSLEDFLKMESRENQEHFAKTFINNTSLIR